MRRTFLVLTVSVLGCTHAQLERTGDAMLRAERATQALSDGAVQFGEQTKAECVAKDLQAESERAQCVAVARKVVEAAELGVSAVKTALVSFWGAYAVLETRAAAGGRLRASDLHPLLADVGVVGAAYADLVRTIQEAKK